MLTSATTESCVLDCIFDRTLGVFYVLDIMCWRGVLADRWSWSDLTSFYRFTTGHPVVDSDAEFRSFWLASKLDEEPALSVKSAACIYTFAALPRTPCTADALSACVSLASFSHVDGILLYHKEVCWH